MDSGFEQFLGKQLRQLFKRTQVTLAIAFVVKAEFIKLHSQPNRRQGILKNSALGGVHEDTTDGTEWQSKLFTQFLQALQFQAIISSQ